MKLHDSLRVWRDTPLYKKQSEIHWLVWLIENPESPISLTGAIDLYNHDIIHVLLDRGMTTKDEAMVIGFTMGNSVTTSSWVRWLFEFIARHIYPEGYKFNEDELIEFARGYGYTRPERNIHLEHFDTSKDVEVFRKKYGIELINTK